MGITHDPTEHIYHDVKGRRRRQLIKPFTNEVLEDKFTDPKDQRDDDMEKLLTRTVQRLDALEKHLGIKWVDGPNGELLLDPDPDRDSITKDATKV